MTKEECDKAFFLGLISQLTVLEADLMKLDSTETDQRWLIEDIQSLLCKCGIKFDALKALREKKK